MCVYKNYLYEANWKEDSNAVINSNKFVCNTDHLTYFAIKKEEITEIITE